MPLIPTFSSYGPKADLSGAWTAGQQTVLERQKIAQQAAEAASRISLGYAQLHADMVKAEMANAAQKEISARQAMRDSQELEMDRAYKMAMAGIAEKDLQRSEKELALKVDEATRQSNARQVFQSQYAKYRQDPNMSPQDAAAMAMLDAGPTESGGFPAPVSTWMSPTQRRTPTPKVSMRTNSMIQDSRKELADLKSKEFEIAPQYKSIALEVERTGPGAKSYQKLGKNERGEVDRMLEIRQRIQQLTGELDTLFSQAEKETAFVPPELQSSGTQTNRPAILRKTVRP
jgi:hypothetical protein